MNTAQKPIEASGNAKIHRRPLREWAINITAALFWAFYAAVFLKKALATRDFMSLGLWLYYSLVVWLFITRAPAKRSAPWPVTLVALCSMALPVVISPAGTPQALAAASTSMWRAAAPSRRMRSNWVGVALEPPASCTP
mgnify:CR=1 FL=1